MTNRRRPVQQFWIGFLLVLMFAPSLTSAAETSALWGRSGERWKPDGRMPDFSYAGYHRGELPLPVRKPDVSVKDFGAVGDGKTDDTAAFKNALLEAKGKTIGIPAGRYVITDILTIRDSGTVLQGAGPQKTVLFMPRPLENIRPNMGATTTGDPTSNYAWSGGIVWVKGSATGGPLAKVTKPARRGESVLFIDQAAKITIGDDVQLAMRDDEARSLTHHLYAGDPGNIDKLKPVRETWHARVVAIDRKSGSIRFDRPLRTDVRTEWSPVLSSAGSTAEEIGIENLAFEFPVTPYKGHFSELGFNAIAMSGTRNCWVRDIEIRHADSGIFLGGSNNTIAGVVFVSERARDKGRNSTGHHGITLGGTDQLLANFDYRTKFIHDITVSRGSAGNVIHRGSGEDLTFDHHKYANHANLFTNIDTGVGTNIFRSGGGAKLGRNCGAWTTWWNVRTERPVRFPVGWATDMINVVGVRGAGETITDPDGRWFEPISPSTLRPADIYEAQLERRQQSK